MVDYYELFQLDPNAAGDVMKRALVEKNRHLVNRQNRAKGQELADVQRLLALLDQAEQTLLDPARRRAYDAALRAKPEAAPKPEPPKAEPPASATPPAPAASAPPVAIPAATPPTTGWLILPLFVVVLLVCVWLFVAQLPRTQQPQPPVDAMPASSEVTVTSAPEPATVAPTPVDDEIRKIRDEILSELESD